MALYAAIIDTIIKDEGGMELVNQAHDHGGRTYAGVSEVSNPSWEGWELLELPSPYHAVERHRRLYQAVTKLYREQYWDKIQGDSFKSQRLANLLMTIAVMSGRHTAVRHFQSAVNANDPQIHVNVDGVAETHTLEAIKAVNLLGNEPDLIIHHVVIAQMELFIRIVKRDREEHIFFLGWVSRLFRALDSTL